MTTGTFRTLFCFAIIVLNDVVRGDDVFRVVGYAQNDVDFKLMSPAIESGILTHLNLAFENPLDDSGVMSYHPTNDQMRDAARLSGAKVLVSVGGGSIANDAVLSQRYVKLLSSAGRQDFARQLGDYVVQHDLDGVDMDLEGPAITGDYGPFIELLSSELRAREKLLTAALSQGYGGENVPSMTLQHFDFVNVMAYDARGPWRPQEPGQHSSFDFAKSTTEYWVKRGLPESKVVLGVPFYGYGFGVDANHGIAYRGILQAYPDASKKDEIGNTIFYNGTETIAAKTEYALSAELGGIMIWAINQDAVGDQSLLKTIGDTVKQSRQ